MKIIKKDNKIKLVKDVKVFLKKTKKKTCNIVVNDKIYQKMKNKHLLSMEKNIKVKKCLIIIIRNSFHLENLQLF